MPPRLRRLLPALAPATAAAVALALVVVMLGAPSAHAGEPGTTPPVANRPDARPPVPRPPTKGERAARIALTAVGVPYRWGGESPASGFDCSGLVRWSYGRVGIDLPHNSYALYSVGRRVPRDDLEAGDVLFFEGLGHVGLYLGEGRMVHAPQTGRDVEVVRLASTNYGSRLIGARRMAAA
jgi:cell wall-associated NlpC family hydrolase